MDKLEFRFGLCFQNGYFRAIGALLRNAVREELAHLVPSPVVELNRAVAVAMAFGPAAGLEVVDRLTVEPSHRAYHLLQSVRGDLLKKLGHFGEARIEFERDRATHNDESTYLKRYGSDSGPIFEGSLACIQFSPHGDTDNSDLMLLPIESDRPPVI